MKIIFWILGIVFIAALVAWLMDEEKKAIQPPTDGISNPEAKSLIAEFNQANKALTSATQVNTGYTVNNEYQITALQNQLSGLNARINQLEISAFS